MGEMFALTEETPPVKLGSTTSTSTTRRARLLATLAALSLVAAACGGSSSDASAEVFISGSSTVEPISILVAEMYEEVAPDVFVDVTGPGTGDGFQQFCNGETDISDASRQIKEEEIANCEANGITFTELLVGIDGIAVMTNNANDAVDCVTFDNLYGLIGPESEGITTWAGANDVLGEGLPEAPLDIFGPGAESGTFDSFIEIVLEETAEERGQNATARSDYNPSAEDNLILQGIQSSDTSLGWVGFAFANDDVKLLEVDGGDGCVAPTAETIASTEYPISRNLYIYVNNEKAAESEALSGFVDFYVGEGLDSAVDGVGYVALSDDAKAEVRAAWNG